MAVSVHLFLNYSNSFFCRQVATNLVTLQTCLTSMMGRPITMDQLRQDVGNMVEKITKVITSFRDFRLSMQEYVCLKVVAMLTQDGEYSKNNHLRIYQCWDPDPHDQHEFGPPGPDLPFSHGVE